MTNLADYKAQLIRYRNQHNRFNCPICGGHTLTFSPAGKWNCWSDPSRVHRIDILRAIVPNYRTKGDTDARIYPQAKITLPFIPNIPYGALHLPFMSATSLSEVNRNRTIYRYSDEQRVIRLDYYTHKVIRPQYLSGKHWVNGAGERPWMPFGLSRLNAYPGKFNIILVVEGQKCVEFAYRRGLPAVCLEAGDYSYGTIEVKLEQIERKLRPMILAILPDNDAPGYIRATEIARIAKRIGLPTLMLDPLRIEPQLKLKGDIEQMSNLNERTLIQIVKDNLKEFKTWKIQPKL